MSTRRLFWHIVDKIEYSINQGDYPAGSRLPPERELAETFNVSRPTIREAIIALEVRGRVQVKTGSGVYVLASELISSNQHVNAFEVTQARALIEGEVAAMAAISISNSELLMLKQTLTDMENNQNIVEADEQFHDIIANATHNTAMILSVKNLWALRSSTTEIMNDYDSVCNKDNDKMIAEHKAIYDALKSGDSSGARNAMHNHFNRLINSLFDEAEAKSLEEIRRTNNKKRDLYSLENIIKASSTN